MKDDGHQFWVSIWTLNPLCPEYSVPGTLHNVFMPKQSYLIIQHPILSNLNFSNGLPNFPRCQLPLLPLGGLPIHSFLQLINLIRRPPGKLFQIKLSLHKNFPLPLHQNIKLLGLVVKFEQVASFRRYRYLQTFLEFVEMVSGFEAVWVEIGH